MKVDVAKIEALREAKGWSLRQLALESTVHENTLYNSIRRTGNCSKTTAGLIAQALGVPAEDLYLKQERFTLAKEEPKPEIPAAIEETLKAVKEYGEKEYQRGKDEMCSIFIKAVKEAIERWEENNG